MPFSVSIGAPSNEAVAAGSGGGIAFVGAFNGSTATTYAGISGEKANGTSGNTEGVLRFGVRRANNAANLEAMRIDSSGNLLVGTTADNPVSARVNGSAFMPGGGLRIRASDGATAWGVSGSSGQHITWYTDNGSTFVTAGAISSNGSTTTYGTSSDYRMKTDVQPMIGALSKVLQLNPVTYKWKPEFAGTNENSQGFIAHELQEVVPECVTGEKDAVDAEGKPQYQGIDTSFLVATLTAAIQEQQAIITALTTRVEALEAV
jgi:hypothetical protein